MVFELGQLDLQLEIHVIDLELHFHGPSLHQLPFAKFIDQLEAKLECRHPRRGPQIRRPQMQRVPQTPLGGMRSLGWEEVTVVRIREDWTERRGCVFRELSSVQDLPCLPSSCETVLCQAVGDAEPRERGPGIWPQLSTEGAPRGISKVLIRLPVFSAVIEFK